MADIHTTTYGLIPRAGRSVSLLTCLQQSPQLSVMVSPFAQTDWPVPRGAAYPLALRTLTSLMSSLDPALAYIFKIRRMERTTAKVGRRADIARMEQTTTKSARRVDE